MPTHIADYIDVINLQQLRHDLLNPINVLMGAASGLRRGDLTEAQAGWVRLLESATSRLTDIAGHMDRYQDDRPMDGQARLADLCSIAAARLGKPFGRERLLQAIGSVGEGRTLRILLVDDSPEMALLVRAYLEGTPWRVDEVGSGEDAVSRATTENYDIVLMDIDLPGLDGTAAAHAIRAAELARGASPTPIIAMTAFDSDPPPPSAANENGGLRR
jgi:CheY-like chemotaxis protein